VLRLKSGAPQSNEEISDDVGIWPRLEHDGWMERRNV
jgi:hypothetical protein